MGKDKRKSKLFRPTMWERITKAARLEGKKQGRDITASQYIDIVMGRNLNGKGV